MEDYQQQDQRDQSGDAVSVTIGIDRSTNSATIHPALPEVKDCLRYAFRYWEQAAPPINKQTGKPSYHKVPGKRRMKVDYRDLFAEMEDGGVITHCGMVSSIKKTLEELSIPYLENFTGEWPSPVITKEVGEGLREEQIEAVSHLIAAASYGGGMVEAATGIGKTRIIASIIKAYKDYKIAVVTKSVSVIRGLHSNLSELLAASGIREPIGICYAREKTVRKVTIATLGTVEYLEPDEIDVLIVDECHTTAGDSMANKVLMFTKALRFGVSGTISNRFDGKERLLEAMYGPIVFTVTDDRAEKLGRVCPLNVYFLKVDDGPDLSGCSDITRNRRGIWSNKYRNNLVKEVCDLAPDDQQLLIFVSTIKHLEELQKLLPNISVCHGELSNEERKRVEEDFVSGKTKRLISTDCLSTGIDPKQLMIMIDASAIKGDSAMPQKRGRLRRWADGKTHGVLVNFADNWDPSLSRRAINRVKDYQNRGDNVIMNALPSDIRFVESNPENKNTENENGMDMDLGDEVLSTDQK